MGRKRFTVAGLMGFVIVAAVGLAALTHPTPLWTSVAFSLALAVNFGALVAVISLEGRGRKIAAGFAVCGWGYLLITLAPGLDTSVGLYLITTPALEWFYMRVFDPFNFSRIVHSFLSIASGLAGASFARWLALPGISPLQATSITDRA
jgi:hypothetical protein